MAILAAPGIYTSPLISWTIISCHIVAITCTLSRLLYRWHTKRFWWEDVWAMIAAMWAIICLVGFLLHDSSLSQLSSRNRISEWFATLAFTLVVWAVRFSIFMSLVRVSNPTGSSRHIALACIASFLIMCVASTAQKIYYCVAYDCIVSSPVAVMQLITDVLADTILVLTPVLFLRDLQLSRNRRILILSAFSSSILISAISIAHSVLLFHALNIMTLILAEIKVATSLFICNILVLVTFIYCIWRRGKGDGIDLDASIPRRQTLYLTTIDLGQLTAGTHSSGGGHISMRYAGTNASTHTSSMSRHCTVQDQDASATTTGLSSWTSADVDSAGAGERSQTRHDGVQAASVVLGALQGRDINRAMIGSYPRSACDDESMAGAIKT